MRSFGILVQRAQLKKLSSVGLQGIDLGMEQSSMNAPLGLIEPRNA